MDVLTLQMHISKHKCNVERVEFQLATASNKFCTSEVSKWLNPRTSC